MRLHEVTRKPICREIENKQANNAESCYTANYTEQNKGAETMGEQGLNNGYKHHPETQSPRIGVLQG